MLTRHERIMRIFKRQDIDRPALKLWGAFPGAGTLHPNYAGINRLAMENSDIFMTRNMPFNIYCGTHEAELISVASRPCGIANWHNECTTFSTPLGELSRLERVSDIGEPGYTLEYLVKDADDLRKLLSMPYAPMPVDIRAYQEGVAQVGDAGICMMGLDHVGYAVERLCGSELFAILSVDEPELIEEACDLFAGRLEEHVKDIIETGIKPVYAWVGPEVLTPPLMNMNGFMRYVAQPDKRICTLIHESGGYVWVHCHGKVAKLLETYIDVGIDVLNPLEPPKNGDVDMADIVARFGNRIGLEGNIEIQELLDSPREQLRALMEACVEAGAPSGRFILGPSAGYEEYVFPTKNYLDNLAFYLTYGLELVQKAAYA